METINQRLVTQFLKLMKNPLSARLLTVDLYDFMYARGGFIAHFDREGFHDARFTSVHRFDHTLELMRGHVELNVLLNTANSQTIAQARRMIAMNQAAELTKYIQKTQERLNSLQAEFNFELSVQVKTRGES